MKQSSVEAYRELIDAARRAIEQSIDTLTDFRVGAALLCKDGTVITGSNFGYSAITNICAERCALARANAEGKREFTAVAVAAVKAKNCWPCGVCRQHLFEVAKELDVVVEDDDGQMVVEKLSVLLPQLVK